MRRGVLDDGAALSLDAARFRRVLAPKLEAARALDRLTAGDAPSLFLMFGSATTTFGNPGQANYVAANAGSRRWPGTPGGREAGALPSPGGRSRMSACSPPMPARPRRCTAASASPRWPAAEALAALPALLAAPHAAPLLVRLTAPRAPAAAPDGRADARRAGRRRGGARGRRLRARLLALPRPEAEAALLRLVQEEVGRILRLPPETIGADAPVTGLGLDSLGALELRGGLEQRLGVQVALAALTEELTVGALARQIADAALAPAGDEATISTLMESFEPMPETVQAAE
jgi:acyl carrier protein